MYIFVVCTLAGSYTMAQPKWPVPFYLEKYGVYLRLTNDISLNDTAKIVFSENTFFRLVLFDGRGKCYFEAYKYNKLYEKGYYENSLDTLKKYSHAVRVHKRDVGGYRIFKYFHPLKDGLWYETIRKKLIKKKYIMGIEENN